MSFEPLRPSAVPTPVQAALAPRCVYKDAEPLTDARWARDGSLYCVRRRPGRADLLRVGSAAVDVLLGDAPILGLCGHLPQGIVINAQTRILACTANGISPLWETQAELASCDVSETSAVVALVGRPPNWKLVVVSGPTNPPETPGVKRIVSALWLDAARVIVQVVERKRGEETTAFLLRKDDGIFARLFATNLMLRADLVSNGRGRLFVSGGAPGPSIRGVWLFDPLDERPHHAISGIIPTGQACFVDSETVAYPTEHGGVNAVVVAGHNGVIMCSVPTKLPIALTASPDGSEIAWAEPSRDGGRVWVAPLPRRQSHT